MQAPILFQRILAAQGDEFGPAEAAQAVAGRMPGAKVQSYHVAARRSSQVLDGLLQHTMDTRADLLVLGAHRHVLASRAAMLAPASVLMVPAGAPLRFDLIVVPVDFSDSSALALRCAQQLAGDGSVVALAVECDEDPWLDWPEDRGKVQRQLTDFVTQTGMTRAICQVEALSREGVRPSGRMEGGDVAATIVRVAERMGATLLVMGTRGRTTSASLLLGSVTEQVMQQSRQPVLALKNPGAPMDLLQALLTRLREPSPVLAAS